ncbi:MAG: glycosyltransferase family 2 protein [Gaiellaceae bacterium]
MSSVSAVILAHKRSRSLELVLDRLAGLPVDEVLVVDNGGEAEEAGAGRDRVRVLKPGSNIGVAGRNLAAREARGDLLLMLDDDSYPLAGAVETLTAAFESQPRLAAAGGFVRDVDLEGRTIRQDEVGTFDWYLRAGRPGAPPDGLPSFFFPEGASLHRREAFLEAGGFFEPYFQTNSELDLTTRLVALGWDVRYFPNAAFDHLKEEAGRTQPPWRIRRRIRNHLWYFWLRFPPSVAVRRIPAYLIYDLIQCTSRGLLPSWFGGIADAWRERDLVRHERRPLPREVLRRAELNRGRMHVRVLLGQARKRLRRR